MKTKVLFGMLMLISVASLSQNKAHKNLFGNSTARSVSSAMPVNPMYSFSTFTSAYNAISGTTVSGGQKWDDLNYTIPIGFTFTLYTQSSNSINIGWGGQLLTFNDPDVGPNVTFLAAIFEDLCDRAYDPNVDNEGDPGGVSPISYTTVGTAGNRICKIQIANAGFFGENDLYATSTSSVNFQMWLYETSNRIEFRYGSMNILNPSDNLYNGVTGFVTGLAESVDVSTGNSVSSNMLDGPYVNPNVVPWSSNIDTYVAGAVDNGRVYRFDRSVSASLSNIDPNEKEINIFPNPASTFITLSNVELNHARINIYDLCGKQIKLDHSASNNTIDVSSLGNGTYFVHIADKEKVSVRKLVIAK
jgi:hypothetical protein